MKKLVDKLRDKLCDVWEWIKVIIGGIVLGSFFGTCGVCDIV